MEIDLRGRVRGSIWMTQDPGSDAGLLVTIYHSKRGANVMQSIHRHRITHACFDSKGSQLLTADHRGDVFLFKLDDNHYKLVYSNGAPLTAIAFAAPMNRILIADADNWIRCVDITSGAVIEEWGDKTRSTVHKIDICCDDSLAVITWANEAMLFQMQPLLHVRNLHGAENTGVQQVLFRPGGANLITAFKDDSIMLWSTENLQFVSRLPLPASEGRLGLKTFAMSRDGKYLLAGGKCRCIFLYNLESERLVKGVELPEVSRGSRSIYFLWAETHETNLLVWYKTSDLPHMCAVLGHDGLVRFIDLNSAQILSKIGPPEFSFCDDFVVDTNARYLGIIHATGELALYDIVQLLRYAAKHKRQKQKIRKDRPHSSSVSVRKEREKSTESVASTNLSSSLTDVETLRNITRYQQRRSVSPSTQTLRSSRIMTKRAPQYRCCSQTLYFVQSSTPASFENRKSESKQGSSASLKDFRRYLSSIPREAAPTLHEAIDQPTINFLKLRQILLGYGEYPVKYRRYIWKRLLSLPRNTLAYNSLSSLGIHPAYKNLQQQYPLRSRKMQRLLLRTISCLAHWAPIFADLPYLPSAVFPFVYMFNNNAIEAFEVCATVLINWCQLWFEFFPNPPISIFNIIENLLAEHDVELLQRFVEIGATVKIYAWPLLQNMFSDVFAEADWLRVWDNIISNHPGFIIFVAIAYLKVARVALLHCESIDDLNFFLHKTNAIDAEVVVKTAYELASLTSKDNDPYLLLQDFKPLTPETYPIFNQYPEFVVDYQVREREKIRDEEAQILHERSLLELNDHDLEKWNAKESLWKEHEDMLEEAEKYRHTKLKEDLQRMKEERRKLEEMKHEQQIRQQKVFELSRREFLKRQHRLHQLAAVRMDDEIALARDSHFRGDGLSDNATSVQSIEDRLRSKYCRHRPDSNNTSSLQNLESYDCNSKRTQYTDCNDCDGFHQSSHNVRPRKTTHDVGPRRDILAENYNEHTRSDYEKQKQTEDNENFQPKRHICDDGFAEPLNRMRSARGKIVAQHHKEIIPQHLAHPEEETAGK